MARCAALAVLVLACSSAAQLPPGHKLSVSFHFENNLLILDGARVGSLPGRFAFSSAAARSAIDPPFAERAGGPGRRGYMLQWSRKDLVRFRPVPVPLHGVADALIGADGFPASAVSIDYYQRLITFESSAEQAEEVAVSTWSAEPSVDVIINGLQARAIIDTASPETMIIPRSFFPTALSAGAARAPVDVTLAGTRFAGVSVRLADTTECRVGNRLLSKFLVWIDYDRKQAGFWRDPRIPGNV
jgi:hypothetical protein